jgi:hypothetical protein
MESGGLVLTGERREGARSGELSSFICLDFGEFSF